MKQQGKQKTNMQQQENTGSYGVTESLFYIDKVLMYLSAPFILFLIYGAIFGLAGASNDELFVLFAAHLVIYTLSRKEKVARDRGFESKPLNMLVWFCFSFLLGYFLTGMFLGFVIATAAMYLSQKFELNSNYVTLTMAGVWFWNIFYSLFMTPYKAFEKLGLIYSPSLMNHISWLYLVTFLVVLAFGIYKRKVENPTTMQQQQQQPETSNSSINKEEPKQEEPYEEAYEEPTAKSFFEPSRVKRSLKEKLLKHMKF